MANDKYGNLKNSSLAEDWSVSKDGLTLYLQNSVRGYGNDADGEEHGEVTAKDPAWLVDSRCW